MTEEKQLTTGLESIAPLAEPTYRRVKIVDSDECFTAVRQVKTEALSSGLVHFLGIECRAGGVTVKATDPNGVDQLGDEGDSIVLTYHGENLCAIIFYNGPDGTYNNPLYSGTFPEETGS